MLSVDAGLRAVIRGLGPVRWVRVSLPEGGAICAAGLPAGGMGKRRPRAEWICKKKPGLEKPGGC